ncbi:helix-turn-helix domain-containing protein [uncultured Erythrobacter sp.]|uniref:winged helix-turn-helix transcriptional regulator n=1 Tax=uncultured Erythrobacter sp. TaxID=263913 RepID=UPI0026176771|nr:helix-turn-helix domain-containing protein [uncultured Erythrobacter sp.]
MKVKSFEGMVCSIAGALEWVGDRWTMLVLRDLFIGLTQFEEFRESTGISPTTLSSRLNALVDASLVTRKPTKPGGERLEYRLTQKGRDLWPVMLAIAHWGDRHEASGKSEPPILFVDRETGKPVELQLGNREDGSTIRPQDIEIIAGPSADSKHQWRFEQAGSKVIAFPGRASREAS